jgi:hypothetical protein
MAPHRIAPRFFRHGGELTCRPCKAHVSARFHNANCTERGHNRNQGDNYDHLHQREALLINSCGCCSHFANDGHHSSDKVELRIIGILVTASATPMPAMFFDEIATILLSATKDIEPTRHF